MKKAKFYCFILVNELFDFGESNSIQINSDLRLSKANERHIVWFKTHLEILHYKRNWVNYFENELLVCNEYEAYKKVKLKKNNWRYTVLEYNNLLLSKPYRISLKLSKLSLSPIIEIAIEIGGDETVAITNDQFIPYNLLIDNFIKYNKEGTNKNIRQTPGITEIDDFNKTHTLVTNLLKSKKAVYTFIIKALSDFENIHAISDNSSFKLLSYFSIIESLITYQPRNSSDTVISRQLSQKLKFLYNNFMEGFSFTEYFKGSNTNTFETIIKKLYNYRNDIAHGNLPKLDDELKIINDNLNMVIPFMDMLLKNLLIISINKPNILVDLREC